MQQTDISEQVASVGNGGAMWFMHDGCPACNYRPARAFLQDCFNRNVIGTYDEPFSWPPRLPDLNPSDFFLWGHITFQVYSGCVFPTVADLQLAITNCCNNISHFQLLHIQNEFVDRLNYCVVAEGGLFEHLIQ